MTNAGRLAGRAEVWPQVCFDVFVKDAWAFVSDRRSRQCKFWTPPPPLFPGLDASTKIKSQDSTHLMCNSSLPHVTHSHVPHCRFQMESEITQRKKKDIFNLISPQLHDSDMTSPCPRQPPPPEPPLPPRPQNGPDLRPWRRQAPWPSLSPTKPCHDWSRHHPSAAIAWREWGLGRESGSAASSSRLSWTPSRWAGDGGHWLCLAV